VPIGPVAVARVRPDGLVEAELLDDGAALEARVVLELFELPPHAASSSDAATAPGMRNLFRDIG
jgi:hypothetical protein